MTKPKPKDEYDIFSDPATYRRLSEPYPTVEEANTRMFEFWKELGELRKKHHVRDVLVVAMFAVMHKDGEESEHILPMHYGNSSLAEGMAAFAYGSQVEQRQKRVGRLMSNVLKRAPRPKEDE